jgi:hypothetical protein
MNYMDNDNLVWDSHENNFNFLRFKLATFVIWFHSFNIVGN